MTQIISGHHPIHLMNVEQLQGQAAVNPQTKPTNLGCESVCRLLVSTSTTAIYYYSAQKLILITVPRRVRLSKPRHTECDCDTHISPKHACITTAECKLKGLSHGSNTMQINRKIV